MAARWIGGRDAAGDAHDSILLDQGAHFTGSINETTAAAESMCGCTIKVSFWNASPPNLSFFSVHSSNPPPYFKVWPHVVGAEGPFVLLRARIYGSLKDEYFMYTARKSKPPSLEWLAPPCDDNRGSLSQVREFGIICREYECHYLLVALCDAGPDYKLRVYSSKGKSWSTQKLLNPCPDIKRIVPEKVIRTGQGSLGWVDFSYGLLVCDLRQEIPCLQFIPLPEPLPENRGRLKACHSDSGVSARWFRDLICVNGVLKFIEIEHPFKGTEKLIDPRDKDVLSDSDLIMSLKYRDMDEKHRTRDGWRAFTWSRTVYSGCWYKRFSFDASDILVNESALLSALRAKSLGKFTFKNMYSAFPTLGLNGSILYLMSMMEPNDPNGLVVTIDLGRLTMKTLGEYCFEHNDCSMYAFRVCNLANHLNMSPGIDVSACVETTQGEGSANDPDKKSVGANAPISCKSMGKPRSRRALAGTNYAPNEEDRYRHCEDSNIESMKLRRQLMDRKMKRTRSEGQSQSVVHPSQNLQCYGMLDS